VAGALILAGEDFDLLTGPGVDRLQ